MSKTDSEWGVEAQGHGIVFVKMRKKRISKFFILINSMSTMVSFLTIYFIRHWEKRVHYLNNDPILLPLSIHSEDKCT